MALIMGLLPRGATLPSVQATSYRAALTVPGVLLGLAATFCYMIGFYQTYTFIGDHVRSLHGAGAWLGGLISLAYGVGFGVGVVFDKWIDRTGPGRVMAGALFLVGLNYAVLPLATMTCLDDGDLSLLLGPRQSSLHDVARRLSRPCAGGEARHDHGTVLVHHLCGGGPGRGDLRDRLRSFRLLRSFRWRRPQPCGSGPLPCCCFARVSRLAEAAFRRLPRQSIRETP